MKRFPIHLIVCLFAVSTVLFQISCEKLDLKREIALAVYNVKILSASSVEVSGEIIDEGDGIKEYGFVFSSQTNMPTIVHLSDRITAGDSKPSGFTRVITGLEPRVLYYVRAFATPDGINYRYSEEPVSFIIKDIWEQKSDFGGAPRAGGIAFSLNGMGYIGMGVNDSKGELYDLWQYNPELDTWTQKAEFPSWTSVTSFNVATSNSAIIGLQGTSETWNYDYLTNSWERIDDFPGVGRRLGFGFQLGGRIYFGGGVVDVPVRTYPTDFWEYDPTDDIWTRKQDFPADGREHAISFSIAGMGYVGMGFSLNALDEPQPKVDFWQYNPADGSNGTDARGNPLGAWIRKADAPTTTKFMGFAIDNRGFIFQGNRFMIYDPASNTWGSSPSFQGVPRMNAVGFKLDGKAYMGTGEYDQGGGTIQFLKDFWVYVPDLF